MFATLSRGRGQAMVRQGCGTIAEVQCERLRAMSMAMQQGENRIDSPVGEVCFLSNILRDVKFFG